MNFYQRRLNYTLMALLAGILIWSNAPANADILELINGDHYHGTVIAMTLSNVVFQSEIQGKVILSRDKIAQITLHETSIKPVAASTNSASAMGSPLILSGSSSAGTNSTSTNLSAASASSNLTAQQMRQGVDPKLIEQVRQQVIGQSNPGASQKFNELMDGLMNGKVSVQDVRKQAQQSIDQIQAAKKELGPDAGEMLDSYLTILQKFVQESGTDSSSTASPTN